MPAPIDLRSDTVTLPTAGMRRAMARAKVGDARRGEDPSVRALEEYAAALFGKEAALFVPSGTMGNLAAVGACTRPGDAVAAPASSHIAGREGPGISNLAAVVVAAIDAPGGIYSAEALERVLRATPARTGARVALVTAENTHNAAGGTIFPLPRLRDIRQTCLRAKIPFHIDGSRIFNASVASGVSPAQYGAACDSLMFCLSKGLGAPVGSVLVGRANFIEEARRVAFRAGGGMRKAGIVAAGGLYALTHHVERLERDHQNARALARLLGRIPDVLIVNDPVETNIVVFRWEAPRLDLPAFRKTLAARGVLLDDRNFPVLRAVTHQGVGAEHVRRAAKILRELLGS